MSESGDRTASGPRRSRQRAPVRPEVAVGVLAVGMSIAVWWPAFTLGAWHEPFFDQLLTLWAAATAAAIFVLFQRRGWWWRTWRTAVLLLPSLWLVLNFVLDDENTPVALIIVGLVAAVSVVLGLPFTIWILVNVMWPDIGEGMRVRTRWFIIGVVAAVAVASFLLGLNNSAFLSCEDFMISGNSEPPGCQRLGPVEVVQ